MTNAWTPLLDEVLVAHGGIDRWCRYQRVASTIVTGGKLWAIKGIDMDRTPRRVTTDLRRQWTQMAPFGNPDWTMTWTPEHLQIEDAAGTVIAERDNARESFGDRGYASQWDPLNLAYFNGYAMWTYHAAPFVLAAFDYEVREIEPITHEGETLHGLGVRFPEGVQTHTREQRFYFGADRLLRRHDYEVDIWANRRAAHLLSDYIDVEGLKFPTRRSVFARNEDGTLDREFDAVTIELSDYTLR